MLPVPLVREPNRQLDVQRLEARAAAAVGSDGTMSFRSAANTSLGHMVTSTNHPGDRSEPEVGDNSRKCL